MATVEYSELPMLFTYIMCIRCILLGLLLVSFGNLHGLMVGIAGAIIFGIIEHVATFIVVHYIMRKV